MSNDFSFGICKGNFDVFYGDIDRYLRNTNGARFLARMVKDGR